MARLKGLEISTELRTKANARSWVAFTPATIPTGQDPRRLTVDSLLPMLIVHINGTVTAPRGIGGHMEAIHGASIFLGFKHQDGVDLNLFKLQAGAEIFDFIADNKVGTNYKLFLSDRGENGAPQVDYQPDEERVYLNAGAPIGLLKVEFAVRQATIFGL